MAIIIRLFYRLLSTMYDFDKVRIAIAYLSLCLSFFQSSSQWCIFHVSIEYQYKVWMHCKRVNEYREYREKFDIDQEHNLLFDDWKGVWIKYTKQWIICQFVISMGNNFNGTWLTFKLGIYKNSISLQCFNKNCQFISQRQLCMSHISSLVHTVLK